MPALKNVLYKLSLEGFKVELVERIGVNGIYYMKRLND